jgi:hypothetical protein
VSLREPALQAALHGWTGRVLVETGTFRGEGTRLALRSLPIVYTIEQSATYYRAARQAIPQAHHRYGDSALIVAELAADLREPVLWFLDANWWTRADGNGAAFPALAGAGQPSPLARELDALVPRPRGDVILLDRAADLGQVSARGDDRRAVTIESIVQRFPTASLEVTDGCLIVRP